MSSSLGPVAITETPVQPPPAHPHIHSFQAFTVAVPSNPMWSRMIALRLPSYDRLKAGAVWEKVTLTHQLGIKRSNHSHELREPTPSPFRIALLLYHTS